MANEQIANLSHVEICASGSNPLFSAIMLRSLAKGHKSGTMKTDIGFNKFYPSRYWFFHFRKYRYVKGFNGRIFGIYFNVRENNATEKLIAIWKKMNKND